MSTSPERPALPRAATVAYGFWLHRMTGSATKANRFGREYGVVHHPGPDGVCGLLLTLP
ncbi:DUF6417 family protein [Streptomyces avermitilis]|uniref:DUF6417 family protein n=1 Tax=Streptomyces avermitilis TaxID=33903 RepID=UPI0033AD20D6